MARIKLMSIKVGGNYKKQFPDSSGPDEVKLHEEWDMLCSSFKEELMPLSSNGEITLHDDAGVHNLVSKMEKIADDVKRKATKLLRIQTKKLFIPGNGCTPDSRNFHVAFMLILRSHFLKEEICVEVKAHMVEKPQILNNHKENKKC